VADELNNSTLGGDFSDDNGGENEDDYNERGWPPNFELTIYCAADHRPGPISVQAPFPYE